MELSDSNDQEEILRLDSEIREEAKTLVKNKIKTLDCSKLKARSGRTVKKEMAIRWRQEMAWRVFFKKRNGTDIV